MTKFRKKAIISKNALSEIQNRLTEMETKTIIVNLPIDLTNKEHYEKPKTLGNKDNSSTKPIKVNETVDNVSKSTKFNPKSYNLQNQQTTLFNQCLTENKKFVDSKRCTFISNNKMFEKTTTELMSHNFYNDHKLLNISTPLHCWHCSRRIDAHPCGIPIKYENKKFHIKGFFCDYPCALTYNYDSNEIETIIQERESLIRMMHKINDMKNSKNELLYAPPRESLKKFGGCLNYDEFHKNNKYVKNFYSPIVPLSGFIEENISHTSIISNNRRGLYSFVE